MGEQEKPKRRPLGPSPVPVSRVASVIAEGRATDVEIALMFGVRRQRVSKWRKDPAVIREVERIQAAAAERVGHALADLQSLAIDKVRGLLENASTPPPLLLATAKVVLDMGTKRPATVIEHTGRIDITSAPEAEMRRRAEAIQREIAAELAKPAAGEA